MYINYHISYSFVGFILRSGGSPQNAPFAPCCSRSFCLSGFRLRFSFTAPPQTHPSTASRTPTRRHRHSLTPSCSSRWALFGSDADGSIGSLSSRPAGRRKRAAKSARCRSACRLAASPSHRRLRAIAVPILSIQLMRLVEFGANRWRRHRRVTPLAAATRPYAAAAIRPPRCSTRRPLWSSAPAATPWTPLLRPHRWTTRTHTRR